MFTGIVQAVGHVVSLEPRGGDVRLRVATTGLDLSAIAIGDSICTGGVCLTAVELPGDGFAADVSGETLACTTLGELRPGDGVNLEPSLTLATPLGGHLVSGHVDGVGEVIERAEDARSVRFRLAAPAEIARYIASKGSLCIDGVSLTVNAVDGPLFDVNIVPHTLAATTLGDWAPGRRVNLEVDVVARYLERLLLAGQDPRLGGRGVTRELLAEHGFLRGGA